MPALRLRRLREKGSIRAWVSETQLTPKNIIAPYFVVEGRGVKEPIKTMPGVYHLSVDKLLNDIGQLRGIKSILLFGIPSKKDERGSHSYRKDGIVQKAIKAVKKEFKDLIVITDVCLCGYTSHGHCGILSGHGSYPYANASGHRRVTGHGENIDNDATLEVLKKIAVSHAEAGADMAAPSGMMDGQVRAIRGELDKKGFKNTGILSYAAKYSSNFYGPFREALDSAPQFGDRKSYQMDYRNSDMALREIEQDINEGADIIMVKPALAYLDVIYRSKQKFNVPMAAYNVSGEYSMVKGYCRGPRDIPRLRSGQAGYSACDEKNIVLEILTSIRRAGADFIITYWAKEVLGWLKEV